jgi:alpha-glucoside transport system permease protein
MWLAPALALLTAFLVYPSLDTLRRSFMLGRSDNFAGLSNYRYIFENPEPFVADAHAAILTNVLWLVGFTVVTVGLGLSIAVLAGRVRYEAAVKSAVFIPMGISFVAASVIWRFMYDVNPAVGTVNAVLTSAGMGRTAWLQSEASPQTWLTDLGPETLPPPLQINNFALIAVGVWIWAGFATVVLSAGLKGLPSEILEAARVDGASESQVFWRIVVPLMRPTIAVVATTLVIQALKLFDLVWVMTGGRFGTDVIATLYYKQAFVFRDFGVGAALAVVLFLWIVPVMLLSLRNFQLQEEIR